MTVICTHCIAAPGTLSAEDAKVEVNTSNDIITAMIHLPTTMVSGKGMILL